MWGVSLVRGRLDRGVEFVQLDDGWSVEQKRMWEALRRAAGDYGGGELDLQVMKDLAVETYDEAGAL